MPGAHTFLFTPPQSSAPSNNAGPSRKKPRHSNSLIRALYTVNYDQQQYKINYVISSFSFIVKGIISSMLLKFYRIQLLALRLLTTKHEALGSMKILKCLPRSHLASKRENFLYHSKLLHSNCSLSPGKF